MKITQSFIRIALAAGLVALAACGGSDSSSRQRNSEIETNVQRYEGVFQSNIYEGDPNKSYRNAPFRKDDKYIVSFDLNLDTIDANAEAPTALLTCWDQTVTPWVKTTTGCSSSSNSWTERSTQSDFRSAFSNFSISDISGNIGTEKLSKIVWAKCPVSVNFTPNYNSNNSQSVSDSTNLRVTFAEAPNQAMATSDCNPIPAGATPMIDGPMHHMGGELYDSNGEAVKVTGATFTINFSGKWINNRTQVVASFPNNVAQPTLKELLPTGIDGLVADQNINIWTNMRPTKDETVSYTDSLGVVQSYSFRQSVSLDLLNLTSSKIKDYAPFGLSTTEDATGITATWKRSVDLVEDDVATHVLEWSTDGFANNVTEHRTDGVSMIVPSCLLNPNNEISIDSDISLRVYALDKNGVASKFSDVVTVKKTADNLVCPAAILAAPTNVVAKFSIKNMEYSISWAAPADAGTSTIFYCVESSSDAFKTEDEIASECGISDTKHTTWYFGGETASFRVKASRDTGAVSAASDSVDVKVPETKPVTNLKAELSGTDIKVSWVDNQVPGVRGKSAMISWGIMGKTERGPEFGNGAVAGTSNYILSVVDLGADFVPGASIWIDVQAESQFGYSEVASTSFEYVTATTAAPVVEDTAKTAIVTETATEVQLPAAAVEVAVKVEDVYTGFGVTANDVKSIEYQIDAGSWTAVTPGAALKIPNAASKMAVRVTKTNGETVVSEKAIVRTEETTETTVAASYTTMAPADTTAPVTTEAPASSESSSSNNILLYILGLVVLAAIAGFFFKKKSASTK
jgi:LPXTG-motif cell wall-anchored protein